MYIILVCVCVFVCVRVCAITYLQVSMCIYMHKSASLPHHTKYHAIHSILQLFSANGEGRKGSLLVCEGLSAAAHSATTCSVPEKAGELFLAARRVRDLLSLSLQVCKGVSLCVSASA